jgi:hypothetical protein
MASDRTVKVIDAEGGRKLLVEVTGDTEIVGALVQPGDDDLFEPVSTERGLQRFTKSLSSLIGDTTAAIMAGIEKIEQPSKVQVEFGVELAAEGEVWFIAKGSVNSTIKVAIEWEPGKRPQPTAPPPAGA